MKLWGILRFELAYQLRRPSTWLLFAVLVAFAYLNTGDDSVAEALYEDFFLNSSFNVAKTTVIGTLMWLLGAAVVAGGAAARDVETGMHPLTYTAPVSKHDYLGGRFLAAFALNALLLVAVQVGIVAGVYSPGVNSEVIGPFGAAPYLAAYTVISLPNAFAATSVQFWLAARSGRPMGAYAGSFVLFFTGIFVAALLLYYQGVGSLVDPIGMRFIIEDLARDWTPTERRWRLLGLEGSVLWNRVLWVGVGLTVLAVTWLRFQFVHRTVKSWWWRRKRALAPVAKDVSVSAPASVPHVARRFGFVLRARQTFAIAWASFVTLVKSRVGLAVLVLLPLATFIAVLGDLESGGVARIPTSALVLSKLTSPLSAELSRWLFIPLLLVFCAGELVWRERDAGLGDLTDAMPTSEWSLLLGKFLAVGFVVASLLALLAVGGIIAQASLGYRRFEIGLYLELLLGLQLVEYLLFALLAVVIHALANQKYVGHLLAVVAYAFIALPTLFGIEHNLLVYGAGPWWSYTEMRGFGASLGPWAWFKLYWAAWALLLAVVASLLWARGRDSAFRVRLRSARRRFRRSTSGAAIVAVALVLTLGGFVFYNTNVLNEYLTDSEYTALLADYERRYGRYAGIPQPRLTATRLRIEIYPERRALEIQGTYRLVNRSAAAIDSVHVALVPGAKTGAVTFDRAATAVVADDVRGHRIYALAMPLPPNDSLQLQFEIRVEQVGFGNAGVHESVVGNGTFFTNEDWLPAVGYQSRRELTSPTDRRKHGLPPRKLIASLYDTTARMSAGERTTLDVVIGTAEGQVAVAPGTLRRSWAEAQRRYFHYVTDGSIGNDYTIFSADYAVREAHLQGVAVRIYHDPRHTTNLDRLVRSIEASLGYYTTEFGRYPYSHFTAVEVRGNEMGMHADPSLVRFSEETALLNPAGIPGSHDLPFEIMAHEVAHQWWGHQLEPAFVEGGAVIGEGLAVYSAMGVVDKSQGREQLRRALAFMRQPFPYAPIRRGEPLLRGLDPYLSYRKGPFALHALGESIGRDRVNGALRRLFETHPPGLVPLATMLDLYRELQVATPDSLQPFLRELFEVNTFWDLTMERAAATETEAGTWQVTLEVRARKLVVDTAGVETDVPMNDWVEIGVFAAAGRGRGQLSEPLSVQKHRISSGKHTITVTVPRKPALVGIDPYHVLDWEEREDDNNLERVKIEGRGR